MNMVVAAISATAGLRLLSSSSSFFTKTLNFLNPSMPRKSAKFPSGGRTVTRSESLFASMSSASSASSASSLSTLASTSEPHKAINTTPQPWLFVGLGNPGKRFDGTRHNVGFEMVDYIAEAEGISLRSVSFKSLFGKGFIGNAPVLFAKPQTFMNLSGESVGALVSYYKIPLKQVVVIFDDMDLPFAKLKLLPKGGHGGHNGMKSIINHFKGSKDFPRMRIGIGRPPGKMDPASFVLKPFNKEERGELDFMLQTGLEAARILVLEGFNKSATFVNTKKSSEQLA